MKTYVIIFRNRSGCELDRVTSDNLPDARCAIADFTSTLCDGDTITINIDEDAERELEAVEALRAHELFIRESVAICCDR